MRITNSSNDTDKRICALVGLLLAVCCGSASAAGTVGDPVKDLAQVEAAAEPAPGTTVIPLPQPPSRPKPSRATINKLISRYAKAYAVENGLVHSIIRAESGYDAHAVSPVGAIGLMQIMPATGADYGVASAKALFDAQTNLRVGVRHLKRLVDRYGIGKAVMAYNAGEGVLARHNGFVTYPETQRYTHQVLTNYLQRKGITAYSNDAREITGIRLTPAMANAGSGTRGRAAKGRRLLRRVDLSTLSLRVRPSLSGRALDPTAHSVGPESQPMFVLDPAARDKPSP